MAWQYQYKLKAYISDIRAAKYHRRLTNSETRVAELTWVILNYRSVAIDVIYPGKYLSPAIKHTNFVVHIHQQYLDKTFCYKYNLWSSLPSRYNTFQRFMTKNTSKSWRWRELMLRPNQMCINRGAPVGHFPYRLAHQLSTTDMTVRDMQPIHKSIIFKVYI